MTLTGLISKDEFIKYLLQVYTNEKIPITTFADIVYGGMTVLDAYELIEKFYKIWLME